MNLGTGQEITIKNLVSLISKLTNYKGQIIWNTTRPDGQPKRQLDTSKATQEFNFTAKTDLTTGLTKTIQWYIKHQKP